MCYCWELLFKILWCYEWCSARLSFRPSTVFIICKWYGRYIRKDVTCKLFADDVKIYSVIDNSAAISPLTKALESLCAWSLKWQLSINIPKCNVLHLGKKIHVIRILLMETTSNRQNTYATLALKLMAHLHSITTLQILLKKLTNALLFYSKDLFQEIPSC